MSLNKYKKKGLCYLKGYILPFYVSEFIRMSTEYLHIAEIHNLDSL